MALINCPDCGKEVSTTATHCIHCGCKFNVCPDCESVVGSDASVCPKCGCVLTSNKSSAASESDKREADAPTDGMALRNKWVAESPFCGFLLNHKRLIHFVVELVMFAFIAIFMWKFISWQNADSMQKLADFKGVLDVRWAAVLGLILLLLPVETGINFFLTLHLLGWLRRNKVNNVDVLKGIKTWVGRDDNLTGFMRIYVNAAYMCDNSNDKSRYISKYLLLALACAVVIVGLSVFFCNNLGILMMYIMADVPFEGDYVGLIVSGVGAVIFIALVFVDITGFEKHRDKWQQEILDGYVIRQ